MAQQMSYDKKKLAQYLRLLMQNTTSDGAKLNSSAPHSVLGGAGSQIEITGEDGRRLVGEIPEDNPPTLYTLEKGLVAKENFINECLKDREFATQIGEDALNKKLDGVLRRIVPRGESGVDYDEVVKKDVLKSLRSEVQVWRVRAPISNLKIEQEITIGSVKFVPHHSGIVANTGVIMSHQGTDDVQRSNSDKAVMLQVVGSFAQQGSAWAETSINAHSARIKNVASENIETAINVVRAFTHVFNSRDLRVAFGLPYELSGGQTGFIAESESDVNIQWDHRGMYAPFEINDSVLKHLRDNCCFSELADIAASRWDDLNSIEKALRVAFQWLGRSVVAMTTADAFTLCAISLERLLICNGEETTVEKFSDRLAYVLSDDAEARKKIHRSAKHLYNIRSKIVHSGFEAVEKKQLNELESMAISALVAAARLLDKINSHEELRTLLHDRKLE